MDDNLRAVQTENLRKAIAIMTAWLESDDPDSSLVPTLALESVDEDLGAGLITGLVSLAGRLLARIERLSGATMAQTLQELGHESAS